MPVPVRRGGEHRERQVLLGFDTSLCHPSEVGDSVHAPKIEKRLKKCLSMLFLKGPVLYMGGVRWTSARVQQRRQVLYSCETSLSFTMGINGMKCDRYQHIPQVS